MSSGPAHSAYGTADASQSPQVMVAADGICRTFGNGHTAVHALRGVSFTVQRGQLVALRGRSGSGKTTLLNIIGGLDNPTAGRVWVDGRVHPDADLAAGHRLVPAQEPGVTVLGA